MINVITNEYPVMCVCEALSVPRSSFYLFQKPKESPRAIENRIIKEHILRIHMESKRRYGAPKIHEKMKSEAILEIIPSLKRIQRLMKNMGLFAVVIKRYKPKNSKANNDELPNLLKQDFSTSSLNHKWVADITYIHTLQHGWCYLASVLDLHSHKIVGYQFSKRMDESLVIKALEKAMFRQGFPQNVVIHTDRGSQYLSKNYIATIDKYGAKRSYSAKGNPYDNAVIESFHAILKKEEVYRNIYRSYDEASSALFEFIESWYNNKRIHGSIGYLTPNEFEKLAA